jgi:hypothetical protein
LRIILALRGGATRRAAAGIVGIPAETFSRWMHRDEPRFVAFQELVAEAEAYAELTATLRVTQTPDPHWAGFWLERRRGAEWGRGAATQINVHAQATAAAEPDRDEEDTGADLRTLSDEDLAEYSRITRLLWAAKAARRAAPRSAVAGELPAAELMIAPELEPRENLASS